MKWKCSVCGFIYEGDQPPEKCPKCGAPKEKFARLSDEEAKLVDRSRFTNMLHMKLASLLDGASELAGKGVADNLDPPCVAIFNKTLQETHTISQMIKAEIQGHIAKGKWG